MKIKQFLIFLFFITHCSLNGQYYSDISINNYCSDASDLGSITISLIESNFEDDWVYPFPCYLLNPDTGNSYELEINNQTTTINNLPFGVYECVIDISDYCELKFDAEILMHDKIEIQFQKTPACDSDGTVQVITFGGVEPYTFSWSDDDTETSSYRSGLNSKFYTVKVTDANNCEASSKTYVKSGTDFDPEDLSVVDINPDCNESNGSISILNGSTYGIVDYEWSTGSVSYNITNLSAGEYEVTVWNEDGCSHSLTFDLIDEGAPTISLAVVEYSCGETNIGVIGVIAVSTAGNNLGYLWSTGSEEIVIEDLPIGEYCVTITDLGNNCFTSECYVVEELDNDLELNASVHNNCSSSEDAPVGSIFVSPNGRAIHV